MVNFTIEQVLALKDSGMSNREIARQLGRESQESTIRNMISRYEKEFDVSFRREEIKYPSPFIKSVIEKQNTGVKIFLGDVETSLTTSYHFGRFKQFISPRQVVQEPYLLTFAGKWLNNPAIFSRKLPDYPDLFALDITNDRGLVEDLWHVLDECDIFIAHNARFDKGWANQRFAYYGMQPPSPYQVIDTLGALKESFSLPSNALEAACNYFELHRKLHHEGVGLWIRCMQGEVLAFEEMETYNIGDIPTLEDLYLTVRPFMKKHPNVSLYNPESDQIQCVRCGSKELTLEKGKFATTYLSKFKVYRCDCCGSVMRNRINVRSKNAMFATLANAI